MLRHRVLQNYVQQYGSGIWYMVYGTLGPQPMRACSVFCVRLQETFDATAAFTTRVRAHRLRQDLPPRPGICFPIAPRRSGRHRTPSRRLAHAVIHYVRRLQDLRKPLQQSQAREG